MSSSNNLKFFDWFKHEHDKHAFLISFIFSAFISKFINPSLGIILSPFVWFYLEWYMKTWGHNFTNDGFKLSNLL